MATFDEGKDFKDKTTAISKSSTLLDRMKGFDDCSGACLNEQNGSPRDPYLNWEAFPRDTFNLKPVAAAAVVVHNWERQKKEKGSRIQPCKEEGRGIPIAH